MSLPCTTKILETSPPTLEEAQKEVGGMVEMIRLPDGQLLVNEEGYIKQLALNPTASEIVGHNIVGNALLLKGSAKWK
mgnify:FL=1